jgi:hypothetical protein
MNLDATCVHGVATTKVQPKSSTSFEMPPVGKLLLGATAIAGVTCAIVLPIVIPQAVKHHHHHKLNTRSQNNYVFTRLRSSSSSQPSSFQSSCGP